MSNSSDQWLRFNDVLVDEFTMNDVAVEAECFGGTYKTKANDGTWCVKMVTSHSF